VSCLCTKTDVSLLALTFNLAFLELNSMIAGMIRRRRSIAAFALAPFADDGIQIDILWQLAR
jgi:hypothetical protein